MAVLFTSFTAYCYEVMNLFSHKSCDHNNSVNATRYDFDCRLRCDFVTTNKNSSLQSFPLVLIVVASFACGIGKLNVS